MKRFFKHGIQEKYLVIIAITSVLLFVGGASYALFTMHLEYGNKFGIITGTLEGELKVNGTVTNRLTVNQGETKEFTVTLKNINDRTARYLLYYIGTLPSGVEVGYISDGSVPPKENGKKITKGTTETYIIMVKNTTTSSQTVQLKLDSGLEHIDLTLPQNGHLFEEMQSGTGTERFLVKYTNEENAEFDIRNANNPVNHKMFVYHHEAGAQQEGWTKEELTDYRYIGVDPNNYVTFNGEEAGWRIIGIFTVENEKGEKEKRIKIIKADKMEVNSWDINTTNDWSQSSSMKRINPNTGETAYNWAPIGEEMMGDVKWYLGAADYTGNSLVNQFYGYERGTETCQTTGNCDTDRPTYWKGKVGLIYPSDYGYATSGGSTTNREACLATEMFNWSREEVSDCNDNNWIYKSLNLNTVGMNEWTITPALKDGWNAFYVYGKIDFYNTDGWRILRPVVYLLPDIQYFKGTGSKSNPFVFTK